MPAHARGALSAAARDRARGARARVPGAAGRRGRAALRRGRRAAGRDRRAPVRDGGAARRLGRAQHRDVEHRRARGVRAAAGRRAAQARLRSHPGAQRAARDPRPQGPAHRADRARGTARVARAGARPPFPLDGPLRHRVRARCGVPALAPRSRAARPRHRAGRERHERRAGRAARGVAGAGREPRPGARRRDGALELRRGDGLARLARADRGRGAQGRVRLGVRGGARGRRAGALARGRGPVPPRRPRRLRARRGLGQRGPQRDRRTGQEGDRDRVAHRLQPRHPVERRHDRGRHQAQCRARPRERLGRPALRRAGPGRGDARPARADRARRGRARHQCHAVGAAAPPPQA